MNEIPSSFWSGVVVGSSIVFFFAFTLLVGVRIGMSAKSTPPESQEKDDA